MSFLDGSICKEVRKTVNSSKIFHKDIKEKENYSLICAVLDRVDDSIEFLNNNYNKLSNNNDILLFVVHSCIIVDASKIIMKQLELNYNKYDTTQYFKDICISKTLGMTEEDCLTDIKFFEYFRSIVFAHPFETNRANFLQKRHEIHYSPYLMSEHNSLQKDSIGIMIYSNKTPSVKPLYIPHTSLYNYINNRYQLLNLVNLELKKRIEDKNKEWMKCKINRKQPAEKILQEVSFILNKRYEDSYELDTLINIISYKSKNTKNYTSVNKVKDVIISFIPEICDCIDNLSYERYWDIITYILYDRPSKVYKLATYDLEKIFSYLDIDTFLGNQIWGKQCAKNFSKQFACKWVDIDVDNMDYKEIKLLTTVACYLEKKEEDNN